MFSFLFIVVPEEEKLDCDKRDELYQPSINKPNHMHKRNTKLAVEAGCDMIASLLLEDEMRHSKYGN